MTTASLTQNKKNNVNLVLVPAKSDKPFVEASVYQLIEASEYTSLYIITPNIKNAIAELTSELKALSAGLKGREITYEVLERRDATIAFAIEADEMSASATITTALGGKHLSAKAILNAAQEAGITKGFTKEGLIAFAQEAARAEPGTEVQVIIAKGKGPVNGKNTKIKPLVESAQSRILKPQEREDGSVDMRDLGDIICVKVGDPLAKRIPFTSGVKGYTVKGDLLEPTPGEDATLIAGEGTELSPKNNDILISTLVGLPKIIDNGMMVDKVYQLNNVDVSTGHIQFLGSVIITGDVKESMKVVASGDITIAGFVESAHLEAGGDITIQKGVIGRKQEVDELGDIKDIQMSALINAKGNVFATYCQYAEINCEGSIRIENQSMHNIVNVDGSLWLGKEDKANGKLIGGHIEVGESVHAGIIGATAGSKTIIKFNKRVNTFKERITEIDGRLQSENTKATDLQALAKKLKDLPAKVADPEVLAKVITTFKHHSENVAKITREKELAEQEMQEYMTRVYVEGTERLYHGVEMHVGDFNERTKREYGPSKLTYLERKVHIEPIVNT
ncbi:MAG: DUF342 domain-containing protein [Thalassotalea sp.]